MIEDRIHWTYEEKSGDLVMEIITGEALRTRMGFVFTKNGSSGWYSIFRDRNDGLNIDEGEFKKDFLIALRDSLNTILEKPDE